MLRQQAAASLDHAIRSEDHRHRTAVMAGAHRQRVEDWMRETLHQEVPELPEKPLTLADLHTQPYKFYRTTRHPLTHRRSSHDGSQSARGTQFLHATSASVPMDGSMSARTTRREAGVERSNFDLPDHIQMSPRKYTTERERLAAYMSSTEREMLVNKEPYTDPLWNTLRNRNRTAEIAGEFRFKPINERERIQEAITSRNVGARAFPWEETKLYPVFREEKKDRWKAGPFRARLPPIPIFSQPDPTLREPYQEVLANSNAANIFRPTTTNGAIVDSSHTERFSSCVPVDRYIPLPDSSPRAPHPPLGRPIPKNALSEGLQGSGIYSMTGTTTASMMMMGETKTGSNSPRKSFWKSAITLAHQPNMNGPVTTTPADQDTAQQLFRTYRRHLAY